MDKIGNIKSYIGNLPQDEKDRVIKSIENNSVSDILNIRRKVRKNNSCPYCESEKIVKIGKIKKTGSIRYKCKDCGKAFNELTGTSIHKIHIKDKWSLYLDCMTKGMSLVDAANTCEISEKTAFNWRHKILKSLENDGEILNRFQESITESKDSYFLYNRKGLEHSNSRKCGGTIGPKIDKNCVSVLITSDRHENLHLNVGGRGNIIFRQINRILKEKVENNIILCTLPKPAYDKFVKHHPGIKHVKVNLNGKGRIYHIKISEKQSNKFTTWINEHFNGVSSKYLTNYCRWYELGFKTENSNIMKSLEYLIQNLKANDVFIKCKNISNFHESKFQQISGKVK